MKILSLFSATMLFLLVIGCDGDGDGGDVAADGASAEGASSDSDGDSDSDSQEIVVKADTYSAIPGANMKTATIPAPGAGTFRSVVTWDGDPDTMISFFRKEGETTDLGWAQGSSGFEGTTAVEGGTVYVFYVHNPGMYLTNFLYAIYFTPE